MNTTPVTELVTGLSEFVFEDPTQRMIVAFLVILASIIGIPGNLLVIFAVAVSKKLQTKTNAFVVNLAVSDLTTALVLPFQAVALLSDQWPLPQGVCTLAAGTVWIGLGSSIFNLAMIAFNRFYLITRPGKYNLFFTRRRMTMLIFFTWAFPSGLVIIPPLCGLGGIGFSERYKTCAADSTHPLSDLYSLLSSVVAGVPCLVVIVICYVQIFRTILMSNRNLGKSQSNSTKLAKIDSSGKLSKNNSSNSEQFRYQVRVTINMFLVVCMYLISIMPFTITCLFPKKYHVIPWVSSVLLLNCCMNPIVYGVNHPLFRKVFAKIIRCKLREIDEPSKILHSITSSTSVP